jgi:predicted transglutaminase-like cysteine proteinase
MFRGMAKNPHRKALALVAAAASASFLLAPTPASAQSFSQAAAGSLSWSKTEAILGGSPSALQAILAEQSGLPRPARLPLRPASFSRLPTVTAVARFGPSPGVLNGRPDIFGSVALRVDHTPLDARWQRVEHSTVDGPAARFAEAQRGKDAVTKLEAVDWYVNKRVRFVEDQAQWGRPDIWSPASVTLSRGRGDCEDYAIAKLAMLRRAGFADRDLYLVVLKDLVRRADHAVLVARAGGHMFVLDNGTDQLLDSESVSDYRPILTFAENGTWTHGYRVPSAPINVASDERAAKPTQVAAVDQRSWSASLLALRTGFNK